MNDEQERSGSVLRDDGELGATEVRIGISNSIDVSVIIPTYKRNEDIVRAVDSVLAQTLRTFEVIVVDDNGINTEAGEKTARAMEKYKDDPRVFYIQHPVNKNGAAARNTGIENSRGRYISFLDDDDIYTPERLEKMVKRMDKLDSSWGACYTGYVKHQKNGIDQYSAETVEGDLFLQAVMKSLYIGTGSNLFFRREAINDIGLFDTSFRRYQDLEYLARILRKYKIAYVNGVLMEAFFDVRTSKSTFEKNVELEEMFRNKFKGYLSELTIKQQKEVVIMWDIDWMRYLIVKKKYYEALKMLTSGKVPIKVLIDYIGYVIDRRKNNTCYGFIVNL